MGKALRLVIKFIFYFMIVFPFVGAVVGAIVGQGFIGGVVGFIAAVGTAFWLEKNGVTNRILDKLSNAVKGSGSTSSTDSVLPNLFSDKPTGVETTMDCPNCGSKVTLINGRGKCDSCDSAFDKS